MKSDSKIEAFYVELAIRKKKWLLCCSYNPNKRDFCQFCNCQNIKDKTCFKNPHNPSCADLFITNRPKSFKNSTVIEAGLPDFHKMSLTVMKVFYKKQHPKIVRYWNYHNSDSKLFLNEVKNSIEQEYYQNQSLEFGSFKKKVDNILQKHAPLKKRYVRANQAPLIDKSINKHIMKRSRLRNKFVNTKSDFDHKAYNTQRNLCVSLIRQAKKQFFSNLNTNVATKNKTFWKTLKPFLLDKVKTKSKITLIDKKYKDSSTEPSEEIISDEEKVPEIFNNFFVNIVPNLKTPNNHNCNMDFQRTDDPVLDPINKYKYINPIQVLLWLAVKLSQKVYFLLQLYNMKIFLEKLKFKCFKGITTKQHSI